MNTRDSYYVNAADICLSLEYWPPNGHAEVRAELDHPVRTINLEDYAKKVQDDMMEVLKETHLNDNDHERKIILGEGRTSIITTIEESSGHELMERYEKWKASEEDRLKRKQIDAAKKLLTENGFKVTVTGGSNSIEDS